MILPTAQLCVYTQYDHTGKLLGYAPWLQVGRDPESAVAACFRQYGSNLEEGDWDCVDVHVFGFLPFILSVFTPITTTKNKKIRRIRPSKENHGIQNHIQI